MNKQIIKKQAGFTLLELMIGATLGIFLLGGAINVFLSASQTSSLTRSIADTQERARFLSNYLSEEIERAGWVDPTTAFTIEPGVIIGSGSSEDGANICDAAETAYLTNRCDQIQVSYTGVTDCLGGLVNAGAIGVVTNTYFVQNGDFMCRGNTAAAAAVLLSDVESFQLLYGLDDSDASGMPYTPSTAITDRDGIVDRYIEAYNWDTNTATLMAVKYSILLRSENRNAYDENVTRNYTLFNEPALAYNDRRLRILLTVSSLTTNNFNIFE